ncbi:hypothetical protein Mapa_011542 [Marchantia paleacea]|nr:hypothetical protein Mapa_011542 [Marchantia paleacea]
MALLRGYEFQPSISHSFTIEWSISLLIISADHVTVKHVEVFLKKTYCKKPVRRASHMQAYAGCEIFRAKCRPKICRLALDVNDT